MLLAHQDFGNLDERGVAQRIEAKYLISEYQAAAIRDYIRAYMKPDPFGVDECSVFDRVNARPDGSLDPFRAVRVRHHRTAKIGSGLDDGVYLVLAEG